MPDVFTHNTPTRRLRIELFAASTPRSAVRTDPTLFNELCLKGCRNYGQKHSCPPLARTFTKIAPGLRYLQVILLKISLDQYSDQSNWAGMRAANAVLKTLIDRELAALKDQGHQVVGSGSCRACRPCSKKLGRPCNKPKRRIESLEATGVDVGKLVLDLFGFPLQWYWKGQSPPAYTCVVGGVFRSFPDFVPWRVLMTSISENMELFSERGNQ